MASSNKNQLSASNATVVASAVAKLTRGSAAKLGSIQAAGDVVSFTVPEPTRDNQGFVVIQVAGTAFVGATFALEVSIDGGATWGVLAAATTLAVTGQPGSDTAAILCNVYQIAGFGAGAIFKFGLSSVTSGGPGAVWALVG